MSEPIRIDRRTTLKWIAAVASSLPALERASLAVSQPATRAPASVATGYGTDPDLVEIYDPGDVWPLTFTDAQRRTATALCDVILPADAISPSAAEVGVVDFIDEWASAPYPAHQDDRRTILAGLAWLDAEAGRRFGREFAALDEAGMQAICGDICHLAQARLELKSAAEFFARFRDLVVGGFYTTPEGMRDIRYVGNVALPRFDGPPAEVLRRVGLDRSPDGEAT